MDDHEQVNQPKTFAKITPELKTILNETRNKVNYNRLKAVAWNQGPPKRG